MWLIAGSITVALHAAAWLAFTHRHAHTAPTYLHFSMVEATLLTAPNKPLGTPVAPKHEPRHRQGKPKPRPHPAKKRVTAVVRSKPVPAPPPAKTLSATPHPAVTPEPYTAPNYGATYLHNSPPAYPLMARRRGISGRVLLRAEVTADGHCRDARVIRSSGYKILDETALAAVRKWRFIPATRGSRPVTATVEIPLNFKLQGES